MIAAIVIAMAVSIMAYGLLTIAEERSAVKKRVSIAVNGRLNTISPTLDKERIIAKLQKEQKQLQGNRRKRKNVDMLLAKAGLPYSKTQVLSAFFVLGVAVGFVGLIVFGSLLVAIALGAGAALIVPRIVLSILISKREQAFIDELPNALDILSRGLRAGMPLSACLKQISTSTSDPLKSEFAHILDLHKLGLPLAEAIKRMPDRIDLMDLRFFTIVIEIQQRSGGNLAEIIENISKVIRSRKEMRAKIKSLISEAKTSAIIIGVIPLLFSALSFWSDSKSFSQFWTEPMGQLLSMVSVVFYISGIALFMKISRVHV